MSEDQQPKAGAWLTLAEASVRLGLSERTLRKRIAAGTLPAEKQPIEGGGVAWRVPASALNGAEVEAEAKANEAELNSHMTEASPHGAQIGAESNQRRGGSVAEVPAGVAEGQRGAQIGALAVPAAEFEALRNEVAQLRGALVGGMLERVNVQFEQIGAQIEKKLDGVPDAEAVRSYVLEAATEAANAVRSELAQSIEATQQNAVNREDVAKILDELQKVRDDNARLAGEVAELREDREQKKGFFARLFGGG